MLVHYSIQGTNKKDVCRDFAHIFNEAAEAKAEFDRNCFLEVKYK